MKILGIDYGRKKIGLAVGDTVTKLSEPLKVLSIFNFQSLDKLGTSFSIFNLLKENEVEKIVIGLTSGIMDEEVKNFGRVLEKQTGLPVEFFDETLTTKDAQRLLIESSVKRKRRRSREDAIAAAVMLQFYLEGGLC